MVGLKGTHTHLLINTFKDFIITQNEFQSQTFQELLYQHRNEPSDETIMQTVLKNLVEINKKACLHFSGVSTEGVHKSLSSLSKAEIKIYI